MDVPVGNEPAPGGTDEEQLYRGSCKTSTYRIEELLGKYGKTCQPGDADEEVRPNKGPSGENAGGRPEPTSCIRVHRACTVGPLGELVEAKDHEHQHHRAEGISDPGALAGVTERYRDDEHRCHGRRDDPDRFGQDRGKTQGVGTQGMVWGA